jgi:drug/metabolite transporter (DMT)-like permease
MLLAAFYFAMMNIFTKMVTHLPAMEIVLFRCGISLTICMYLLHKSNISWKGTNRRLLLLRGVFGTLSLYAYFVTIAHMPLGTAVTIQYLSPVFTTILAIFVLGEKVKPVQWLFFIVSFCGVLVIKGFDERVETLYLIIGILSAIGSACAYVTIRTIKNMENPMVVVFHFQLLGTITGAVFSAPVFVLPQGIEWIALLLVGVFTQLGQLSMTKALQLEKIANVSILNYTGIIYALLAGYFLFNEHIKFGSVIGIILVIAGVVMSILYRRQTAARVLNH